MAETVQGPPVKDPFAEFGGAADPVAPQKKDPFTEFGGAPDAPFPQPPPQGANLPSPASSTGQPASLGGSSGSVPMGTRLDGTPKGSGWLGPIPTRDGQTMTELSFDFDTDGQKVFAPLLVPTLNKEEVDHLAGGGKPTEGIYKKAQDFALQRQVEGKSPFKDEQEPPRMVDDMGDGVMLPGTVDQTIPAQPQLGTVPQAELPPGLADTFKKRAEQSKQNAATLGKFNGFDLKALEQYKTERIPQQKATVQALEKEFNDDVAAVGQASEDLKNMRAQIEAQIAADPSSAQSLSQQYDARVSEFNSAISSLNQRHGMLKDAKAVIDKDAQAIAAKEYGLKQQMGGPVGNAVNSFMKGVGDLTAGETGYLIEAMAALIPEDELSADGSKSRDQIAKELKRTILPDARRGAREVLGVASTTDEYMAKQEEGLVGGAWNGLVRSVPGMASPYMSGIFFQTSDAVGKEMEGPEFDDVTEAEKLPLKLGVGLTSAMLERAGFMNLAKNTPFVKSVFASTLRDLPAGATKDQVESALSRNIADRTKEYVSRSVGGFAAEAETGGLQEVSGVGMKDLFNMVKGPDENGQKRLDTPDGWQELLGDVAKASIQEGIAGYAMAQPGAIVKAMSKNEFGKLTNDKQFEFAESILKDENIVSPLEGMMEAQVENGSMTPEQASEIKQGFAQARKIRSMIPDDLPVASRKEAFDLLSQREQLRKKDPALVATKVEAINEKLKALEGVPKTPPPTVDAEGTKTEPEPVQPTGEETSTVSLLDDQSTLAENDQGTTDSAPAKARELQGRGELGGGPTSLSQQDQAPLEGLPSKVEVPGRGVVEFGPNESVREAARKYAEKAGIPYAPPRKYVKVDPERSGRIASEFEKMQHAPNDPKVKASYKAMIDETLAQYQAIKDSGLKIEFIDISQGDPYANSPREAMIDVRDNNHLWVFPTDDGFGSSDDKWADNPMLEYTDEYIGGKRLRANDVFRIVHDYFGHVKEGVGFRADGEENAWRQHSAMYSDLARPAMTSETRGQNSWVNFGPNGEANRGAPAAETYYAPQKVGLLPDWVIKEGSQDEPSQPTTNEGLTKPSSATTIPTATTTAVPLGPEGPGAVGEGGNRGIQAAVPPNVQGGVPETGGLADGVTPPTDQGKATVLPNEAGAPVVITQRTPTSDPKNKERVDYAIPGFEDMGVAMVKTPRGWRPSIVVGDTTVFLDKDGNEQGNAALAAAEAQRILDKHGKKKVQDLVQKVVAAQAAKASVLDLSARRISNKEAEILSSKLSKAIGTTVVIDRAQFNKNLSEAGAKSGSASAKGFVIGSTVYLNPDKVSLDTPLHEIAGHILLGHLRNGSANDRALYGKIITLSKDAPPALVSAIKNAYPDLKPGTNEFWEEVFSTFVGVYQGNLTRAEGVLKEAQNHYGYLKRMFDAIAELFSRIGKRLGIRPDKIKEATTIGQLVDAIGERAYKGAPIVEGNKDSLKKRRNRIMESRGLVPASSALYTLQALQSKGFEQLRGKQVKRSAIEQAMNQQGVKEIEKEIMSDVLKFTRFSGPIIDFDDFANNVSLRITPLRKIDTKSYSDYGMDRLGGRATYGNPRTIIFNTPTVDHGRTGHFPSDFSGEATEWVLKEIPGADLWIAIDSKATGLPPEQMQAFIGTAGPKDSVEQWIGEQNSKEGGKQNKGMFGWIRKWFAGEGSPYYVAELQSDFYQKADVENELADKEVKEKVNGRLSESYLAVADALYDGVNKLNDKWVGSTGKTPLAVRALNPISDGKSSPTELLISINSSHFPMYGIPEQQANGNWILKDPFTDKTWLGEYATEKDADVARYDLPIHARPAGPVPADNPDLLDAVSPVLADLFKKAAADYKEAIKGVKDEVRASINPAGRQMLASVKTWEKRMIREAVQDAASQGATAIRFPTPNTLARIEGYAAARVFRKGGSGSADLGDMPYQLEDEDNTTLTVGEEITMEGNTYLVVEVNGDQITVADRDNITRYSHSEAIDQHMEGWYDGDGYEIRRQLEKSAGKGPYTKEQVLDALTDFEWVAKAVTEDMEDTPEKSFDLDRYETEDDNTSVVFDNSKVPYHLASSRFLSAIGNSGTEQEVKEWVDEYGEGEWEAVAFKQGQQSLFGDDGVWVAVKKSLDPKDRKEFFDNIQFIGQTSAAREFIEDKDSEWEQELEDWMEDDDNTISLDTIREKAYDMEYESVNDNYGGENFFGGYNGWWEDGDGYYVMYEGSTEEFSQPYVYIEAAAERNRLALAESNTETPAAEAKVIDQGDVDMSKFTSDQRTVLSKYVQIANTLRKERKYVEVVEDENGYSWLSSPLSQDEGSKPIVAFSKDLSSDISREEWNAAIDKASSLILSMSEADAIAKGSELIASPEGRREFVRTMNEAWGFAKGGAIQKKASSSTTKAQKEAMADAGKAAPKKIVVNEKAALKDQIRRAARAAREAVADVRQKQKRFSEEIAEALKALEVSVAAPQVRALASRAAKIDPSSPQAIARYLNYVDRVIERATYAADLKEARAARSAAKKASRNKKVPINHREALRSAANVDVSLIDDPATYAEAVRSYLNGVTAPTSARYDPAKTKDFIKQMDSYEKEVQKGYEELIKDEYGIEDIGVISAKDLYDALEAEDVDDHTKNWEQAQRDELAARVEAMASYRKLGLEGYDPEGLTPAHMRMLAAMKGANIQNMSLQQQVDYIRYADNIILNDAFHGAGYATAVAENSVKMEEAKKITEGKPVRRLFSPKIASTFLSLDDAFRFFFGMKNTVGQVQNRMGLGDFMRGKKQWSDATKKIGKNMTDFYNGLSKKFKNSYSEGSMLAEGMGAFAIQNIPGYDAVESFEINKNIIKQDIVEKADIRSKKKEAEVAQIVYDELFEDTKTMEQLREKIKAKYPAADASIRFLIDLAKPYRDSIEENANDVWNEGADYSDPNYITKRFVNSPVSEVPLDPTGPKAMTSKTLKPSQAKTTLARKGYRNLRQGKLIDYNVRHNAFTSLSNDLYDVHTSAPQMRVNEFMKMPDASKVFGSRENAAFMGEMLRRFMKAEYETPNAEQEVIGKIASALRSVATVRTLGGFTQAVKQLPEAFIQSSIILNGRADRVFKNMIRIPDAADLLNKYSIGDRAGIQGGSKWEGRVKQHTSEMAYALKHGVAAKINDASEKLGRALMTALSVADSTAAKGAWMALYEKERNKQGHEVTSWKQEAEMHDSDQERQDAGAYAESMVSQVMVSSDPAKMASISKKGTSGYENLGKAILLPFSSFSIQAASRRVLDMSDLYTWGKRKFNGGPTASEVEVGAAARSLIASTVGAATFLAASMYVAGAMKTVLARLWDDAFDDDEDGDQNFVIATTVIHAMYLMGAMDVDVYRASQQAERERIGRLKSGATKAEHRQTEDQKKRVRNMKMFYTRMITEMTMTGVQQGISDGTVDFMNYLQFNALVDNGDPSVYNKDGSVKKFSSWLKDPNNTTWYRSGQGWDSGTPNLGLIDIVRENAKDIEKQVDVLRKTQED